MKRKAKLPSMGRSYVKHYERLYLKGLTKKQKINVTALLLVHVALQMAIALLIVALFTGCGKDASTGLPGPRGEAGPQGADSIVAIVDPCGDSPTVIDEILIILSDGRVLVSLSEQANGKNTRLALLPPGTYQTTDGSSCTFTVNTNSSISF